MTSWLVPSNPNFYDALSAFSKLDIIDWGNGGNNRIEVGDIVYVYITGSLKQIRIKTEVTHINLTKNELLDNDREFARAERETDLNNFFRLKRIKIFSDEEGKKLHFNELLKNGLSGVFQGKIKVNNQLQNFILTVENGVRMSSISQVKNNNPKNIILYGPPGVGKTYSHKKLIAILENGDDLENLENPNYDFSAFENVKNEERYKFITFHQSYSYEDFIEGFRPNEDGKIELYNGVLRDMLLHNLFTKNIDNENKESDFYLKYTTLLSKIHDSKAYYLPITATLSLELVGELPMGKKLTGLRFRAVSNTNSKTLVVKKQHLSDAFDAHIQKNKDRLEEISKEASIPMNWLSKITEEIAKTDAKVNMINESKINNNYLIIDEINRGNISKIFGELITLIEEDKRLGEPNELTVTLPYSKESFGIPSNLYIIGTMNTADKSIALVDIALRRRFTFVRMEPRDEFLPDEIIQINQIIKNKLSSDYLIGHAFFIDKDSKKIEDDAKLAYIYKYKIKPLIEEYFYADTKVQNEIFSILEDGGDQFLGVNNEI